MNNFTLAILKPDCVEKKLVGKVIDIILKANFEIVGMKLTKFTIASAHKFYEIHKDRSFFDELINYITSGPIIPMVLKKNNAVKDFRILIGSTGPQKAEEGTIRKLFAKNVQENIIHGSDSDTNALKEISHFFSIDEITNLTQ